MLSIIEKGADVAVDHMSTPAAQQALTYLMQGLLWAAARAKTVRKVREILLLDRLQQHPYGLGHDLVLQGRNTHSTLHHYPNRLWNV